MHTPLLSCLGQSSTWVACAAALVKLLTGMGTTLTLTVNLHSAAEGRGVVLVCTPHASGSALWGSAQPGYTCGSAVTLGHIKCRTHEMRLGPLQCSPIVRLRNAAVWELACTRNAHIQAPAPFGEPEPASVQQKRPVRQGCAVVHMRSLRIALGQAVVQLERICR
ncbi:hypothetical protein JKP88DRAFT_221504 [Tribonema minus]|uniref:Uncharacterized protein n=1 Tax=Tribonema minus TaxID=303371 RepID=A0A835YXZ3_9STRA|nr:hypothetical protein JKP88DRAFT_221504 [Tribonema minus]